MRRPLLALALTLACLPASAQSFMRGGVTVSAYTPPVVPSWVATIAACQGLSSQGICLDFIGNQSWDGSTGTNASPIDPSLYTLTARSGTVKYQNADFSNTNIGTTALALGTNGLELKSRTNLVAWSTITNSSSVLNTGTNGSWTTNAATLAAPTYANVAGGAPDLTDATDVTLVAATATNQVSTIKYSTFTTTNGNLYSCSFMAQTAPGSSQTNPSFLVDFVNGSSQVIASLFVQGIPTTPTKVTIMGLARSGTTILEIGTNTSASANSNQQFGYNYGVGVYNGGTVRISEVMCQAGDQTEGDVATTGNPVTTPVVDAIKFAGSALTKLKGGAVKVTAQHRGYGQPVVVSGSTNVQGLSQSIQAGALIGDGTNTFFGRDATDHLVATPLGTSLQTAASASWWLGTPTSQIVYGSGATGTNLGLNGYVITDGTTRSLSSSTNVYLGSKDGTNGYWQGNIDALAIDPVSTALVATASQPVTSMTIGGYPGFYGIGFGAYLVNNYYTFNQPAHRQFSDTENITLDAGNNLWYTGGDSWGWDYFFYNNGINPNGVNVDLGYVPSPGVNVSASGASTPPYGVEGPSFQTAAGYENNVGGCPTLVSSTSNCEWKPGGILAVQASVIGAAHDTMFMSFQRNSEGGPLGYVYGSLAYDTAEGFPWNNGGTAPTAANWVGLPPGSNNSVNITNPTFGQFLDWYVSANCTTGPPAVATACPYPLAAIQFIQNGNAGYAPITGYDPADMNHYIYALGYGNGATDVFCLRIAISDIAANTAAAINALDASNHPKYWTYYGNDGAWHGGQTDWNNTKALHKNVQAGTALYPNHFGVNYNQASGRFMAFAFGGVEMYEAPLPWGPWTPVEILGSGHGYYPFAFMSYAQSTANGGRTGSMIMNGAQAGGATTYSPWNMTAQANN